MTEHEVLTFVLFMAFVFCAVLFPLVKHLAWSYYHEKKFIRDAREILRTKWAVTDHAELKERIDYMNKFRPKWWSLR